MPNVTPSPEALAILVALDNGARFNTTHTTARELIAVGLACDDFGRLALTEAGRIAARRPDPAINAYISQDPHVANLDGSLPRRSLDQPSQPSQPPLELPPLAPVGHVAPPRQAAGDLAWSREHVMRAAGAANAKCAMWVDTNWIEAFMDAYEAA
jgi:hypothetical protein